MITTPKIVVPRLGLEPVVFQPRQRRLHVTDWGVEFLAERWCRNSTSRFGRPPIGGGSGQMSAWAEQQCLNHLNGQDNASWANMSPVFLALCTVVPTSSSTGSTITEATYTGYARLSMASGVWAAASGTAPASASNNATSNFANCTAGTSTITAMCSCTLVTAGNAIFWCSSPSTIISATQSPAQVATGGFAETLT